MKRTADHIKMRNDLMDATLSVSSEYGIEGCTSKRIAQKSGHNEAYVFRYFLDLKDLRQKTFFRLEETMFRSWQDLSRTIPETDDPIARKKTIFDAVWNTLLYDPDSTFYFVRYFLSTECRGEVLKTHWLNCRTYLFTAPVPEEEAQAALQRGSAILLTVFQYAALVCAGLLPNSEETKRLVFKNII